MIAHRKSSPSEPSKAVEQRPAAEQVIPHMDTASAPPPVGGTCMTEGCGGQAFHPVSSSPFEELEGCGN
jgi:hypothetical protein